jgi:hypothetical protein
MSANSQKLTCYFERLMAADINNEWWCPRVAH